VEIDAHQPIIQSDLIEILGLNKVTLSRVINKLYEEKLIDITNAKSDRRFQLLSLRERGNKLLNQFDRLSNEKLEHFLDQASFHQRDTHKLAQLFDQLATALNAPRSSRRNVDHVLRAPIRRLTRAFKLLGSASLDTGLSALEWQVLLTVAEHDGRLTPSDLAFLFKVDRNGIALALRKLMRLKLLYKKKNLLDSRSDLLNCSSAGFTLVSRTEDAAANSFKNLSVLIESEVQLVERFIRGAAQDFYIFQQAFKVLPLSSPQQVQVARRALLKQLTESSDLSIPGRLFCESNLCAGLFREQELYAAIELSRREATNSTVEKLINLVVIHPLHPDSVRSFLLKAIKSGLMSSPLDSESLHHNLLSPQSSVSSSLGELFRVERK
jgi:DNA-binding MarR family transcriptional regulator